MSLMSGLYVGVSGLRASQNSLNATAHNLANAETKGYVRQQVVQADSPYLNWGINHISTLQTGLGTNIAAVRQVRDIFLDKAYRTESGRQGYYEVQYEAVQEIESLFGEMEGVAFQDTLEKFWVSLQELSKEPDSIVKRTSIIQTAVSFIEHAENISKQLKDYQVNLNTQIINQVNRINQIATEISDLNKTIRHYESNGMENANDYRDRRNLLLDELGKIARITYREDMDGVVTVNLEGVQLVTEENTYKLGLEKIGPSSEMLKPVWESTGDDVYDLSKLASSKETDIGSLKGLLIARGAKSAKYTDIPNSDNTDPAYDYQGRLDYYNNQVESHIIMTVQAQFDQLIHGIVTTMNDILSPNKDITVAAATTFNFADGTSLSVPAGGKIKILDVANAPVGMDKDETMGEALFNRKSMVRYKEIDENDYGVDLDGDGILGKVKIYMEEDETDNYSLFTLGEIEVNPNILKNYSLIPLSANGGTGEYDIKIAEKLVEAWQKPFATLSPNTLTKNNFNGYYTAFMGNIATRGEQYYTMSVNQKSMVASIESQREQVIGVSTDEELTNLIKYQHAYNASARYITVIDNMLEHLITRM